MREHSAGVITCCKYLLNDLADKDTKKELLHHAHSLISLLQYYREYRHDIDLITTTHNIIKLSLCEEINKTELCYQVKSFWWICNVYIGADFERLKIESGGKINGGGESHKEATSFEDLYQMFNVDEYTLFPERKPATEITKTSF